VEERATYCTATDSLLQTQGKPATLNAELEAVRARLPDLERQLQSALVLVQLAQGKEPSVVTRRERRRG
jgi:hypothetical protein